MRRTSSLGVGWNGGMPSGYTIGDLGQYAGRTSDADVVRVAAAQNIH